MQPPLTDTKVPLIAVVPQRDLTSEMKDPLIHLIVMIGVIMGAGMIIVVAMNEEAGGGIVNHLPLPILEIVEMDTVVVKEEEEETLHVLLHHPFEMDEEEGAVMVVAHQFDRKS